jgi:biopolymer transport protein ExbD
MARSADRDEYEITSINVTPLVDIMLVLLVIFMVTTTYIVKEAIKVELPRAANSAETTAHTLQIMITRDGTAYLDGAAVTEELLARKIREALQRKEDLQAVVAADKEARHGAVVHVLDLLTTLGVSRFAIQIEKEKRP